MEREIRFTAELESAARVSLVSQHHFKAKPERCSEYVRRPIPNRSRPASQSTPGVAHRLMFRHGRADGDQNPSGSFTKIAVIRLGAIALLTTRTLFTPLGTP
jgi:hypothetical protein